MIVIETWMAEDLELGVGDTFKTHASGGTLSGHQISLSTFSRAGAAGEGNTASWDPSTVANGGSASTTVTVQGAAVGDMVLVSFSQPLQGMMLGGEVSAANTVTVSLYNLSGGVVNLDSGTLKVLVFPVR